MLTSVDIFRALAHLAGCRAFTATDLRSKVVSMSLFLHFGGRVALLTYATALAGVFARPIICPPYSYNTSV